jgi:opacity protein-like surface antigen
VFDVGNKPVLAYPVNASLTLGLGYRYVKGEDLVFRTVDPGSLSPDYDSHNVLLRARWRF